MTTHVTEFNAALEAERPYFTPAEEVFPDPVYMIRTQPGFIFDDCFWDIFARYPFHICHVAYYGPERREDDEHEVRVACTGVFELRFKPQAGEHQTHKEAT